jgi:hypothetical protein
MGVPPCMGSGCRGDCLCLVSLFYPQIDKVTNEDMRKGIKNQTEVSIHMLEFYDYMNVHFA